jgi:hypothetical protein
MGSLRGEISISEELDEPLEDFKDCTHTRHDSWMTRSEMER